MTFRRQPSGSYFGPRPRMPTRLKVPSGLSLRKSMGRFRSKNMMKIDKECQKRKADMMFMKQCKGRYNVNDQQISVVSQRAQKSSPNGSNVGSSNDLVNKDKSTHSQASKHAGSPFPSRTEKGANPFSKEFKYSTASSTRNALPSNKVEKSTPLKSKDDSNVTSRRVDQFRILEKDVHNIESLAQTHMKAMSSSHWSAKNANSSNLNNNTKNLKTNEATNSSSMLDGDQDVRGLKRKSSDNSTPLFGKCCLRPHRDETSLMEDNNCAILSSKDVPLSESEASLKLRNGIRRRPLGSDGKTNDGMCKSKEALSGANHNRLDSEGVLLQEDLIVRPMKVRRYMEGNSSDEDHVDDEHDRRFIPQVKLTCMPMLRRKGYIEAHVDQVGGDQNHVCVESDSVSQLEKLTFRPIKRRRRCMGTNEDEDEANLCDRNLVGVEDANEELVPQVDSSKDCVEQQCYCCSKPIDEPIWSPGTFKMDGKEYTSLAGHLSTKSGEKVWALSSSLPAVLEVTKESKLTAWPKKWTASKPTSDSIGLYFLPHKMRHDEELDQLIREVMDNNLVLRAVIGEAELLILPSVILPERYQTFQNKYYLWGAFKPKVDKGVVITGQQNDKGHCTQEEEKEKHDSSQLDEVHTEEADQEELSLMKSAMPVENQQLPANSIQETKACCAQGPTKMGLELEASEEGRARDASPQAVFPTEATVLATDVTTIPAEASAATVCTEATAFATDATTIPAEASAATVCTEATAFATAAASLPENHGLMDSSSMGAFPGSSSVFSIVVRETPKLKRFIEEMDQEGALIAVVQGEAISASPWLSNKRTTMQQQ